MILNAFAADVHCHAMERAGEGKGLLVAIGGGRSWVSTTC
jgi:hypothetical protein